MRPDDVVPVPVKPGGLQLDTLHLVIGDPPPGGVAAPVQATDDPQALRRGGPRDQVDDRLVVAQRLPAPVGEMNEKRRCSTLFHLLVPGGK